LEISQFLHNAALLLLAVALVANLVLVTTVGKVTVGAAVEEPVRAHVGGPAPRAPSTATQEHDGAGIPATHRRGVGWYADRLIELGFVAVTLSLALRSIVTGHAPFANQYEFATAFVWGVLAMYLYFEWRYR